MTSARPNHASTSLEATLVARENRIISQAMDILDHRLFTRGPELTSPAAVESYLKLQLAHEEHEVFAVVFLDTKLQALAFEVLFTGSIDGSAVYARQVVKRALAHNAAAVILSHNHPSGCSIPSMADRVVTSRLQEALDLIEVRLVDHFIIGHGKPCSMREAGWN